MRSSFTSSGFPWRFAVYALVIPYFVFDLYLIKGPVYKKIHRTQATVAFESAVENLAATVNAHPITETELDEAIRIYCLQRGIDHGALPDKRRLAIRALVLNERIEDILIWMYSRATPVDVPEARYQADYERFRQQFQTEEDFEERLKAQGFSEKTLRSWLRSQTHQRAWIDSKIADAIAVSDSEALFWYQANAEQGEMPERLRARHIFLATPDKESDIRALHARLLAGEATFEQLAAEHSEDERSRALGGDLNFFTRDRMPADFYDAVSALDVGSVSEPFQTKLGWHIAQLTDRRPARRATFEELKPEIAAMLESYKRVEAMPQLIESYRKRARIQFFNNRSPSDG